MNRKRIIAVLVIIAMMLPPAVMSAAPAPAISLHVANKIDVALGVGPTYVDYSNFEAELRHKLESKSPAVPKEDLNILAAQATNNNITSTFKWWIYDHTFQYGAEVLDDAKHEYIEKDVGGDAKHPYINYPAHMKESNNGAQMDFYGYPQDGYTDFRYLPNDQHTKKTFEFAIEEDVAHDALDGVGFLFNTDISGAYGNGQVINGYLLFLQYTDKGKGQDMRIFQLENVDARSLHHSGRKLIYGTPGAKQIASNEDYLPGDKYRRIKLEARPGSVKVWYKGSATDQSVLTTPIGSGADPVAWTTSDKAEEDQKNKNGIKQLFLNRNFLKSFGYGPLCSYRDHNCDKPTHLALQNLSMDMEVVRKLAEVVREPGWNQNTLKFLVNLNEDPIDDFANNGITAELLARLTTDDIYYFGWCSKKNADASNRFLNKHSLKGTIINIDDNATKTFDQQIQKIADEIYARYMKNNTGTTFLVTDNVVLEVSGADQYNTADSDWPDGKWKVSHQTTQDLGWDDGTEGHHILHDQYMSDLDFRFYLPGIYEISYCDVPINKVTVHRAPTARLGVDMKDPRNPKFNDDKSFDPDDLKNGIVKRDYAWIDVETMTTPKPGTPGQLQDGHTYLVTLTVTDKHGATATATRQLSGGGSQTPPNPPYAFFTLEPSLIVLDTANMEIDILNDSYDLYGDPLTKYDFTVTKDGLPFSGLTLTGSAEGTYDASSLPVGNYRVTLTVTSKNGVSQPFVRTFDVARDSAPPVAAAKPAPPADFKENTIVNFRFTDTGGSGLRKQRIAVTNSAAAPAPGDWSLDYPTSSRAVFLEKEGDWYIHWQAEDNAGNKAEGSFGPYKLDKNVSGLQLSAQPPTSQSYGGKVLLRAELDPTEPYDNGRVHFYENSVLIGSVTINGSAAELEYTPDSAKSVVYEAKFEGDKAHKPSSATLAYTVTKSDVATVTVDPQTSREYNGKPFEVANISVSGALTHKVEYRGTGGTVYPSSPTPPVKAGTYEVVVTTTDPNFAEKSVAAPFEIAKRQISVLLRTDPPSGEPATGATVRLTAVIGNTIEAAPGTVTFSADGTVIASGVPARQVGKELIATAEWRQVLAGNQELTAEYVPAAQDNYNNAEDRISDYEVIKANQTGFKFPKTTLNKTYGDPDFLLPAAQGGQGGGGIDYYQIAGDTVISFYSISDDVAILQTGTSVIRAIKNGDSHYNPISADLTVVVAKKANDLAIDAPDTEFGLPVVPAVTVNESGGQLTYVWQGRGSTVYGPAAAPPTAIGDYVLTVSSAETVNYLAASASAEFRIIPCACVLDQANLSGGPIAIDYFKLQETQRLEPTWNFTACSVHGPIFALQYEFSGDHTGAKINGAYPNPVTLTVNDRAIGKKLTVKVKITHVPTGLAATQEAQFTVSKAARENSDAGGARQAYHKTKDGDVVVDISSILQDSGLSAVSVSPVRPGQKPATLTDGRDYKVENDQLVLKEGFMDTLPPGEQIIKIVTADGTEFLLHLDIAPGVLTVEQAGGSGLPAVTTPLTDLQLAGAVLTGQEMDRLNNGFDVKLELMISGLRIPADAAVVAAEAGSKKVGTLFDISLRKTVGTDQPVFISALPNKASVKLQVDLPSNLRGQPRYWLGRVEHPSGGKAYMSLLGARLQNGAALQFETNNFSTYAILYATSVVSIDSESGGGGISAGSAGGGGSSAGGSGSGSSGGGNSVGVGGASTDTGSGAAIASPEPARPNPAPPAQPAPDAQSDRNEPAAKPPALLPANQARPIEDEADSDEPPPPGSNPKTGVPVGKLNDMGIFAALATLGAALMLRVDKRRRKLDPESNE